MHIITCPLCGDEAFQVFDFRSRDYFRCGCCFALMVDPLKHLSAEDEKRRYDLHNNDVNDPGYRQFVRPIVDKVQQYYKADTTGLDYGAGSGPVAAVLLKEKGFNINLYDPFYWNNRDILKMKYDFIICLEVIEHFRQPYCEFKFLQSLLKPGGSLFCMTELIPDDLELQQWYYIKDPTHIFLYDRKSLEWIKTSFSFANLKIEGRLIHFAL